MESGQFSILHSVLPQVKNKRGKNVNTLNKILNSKVDGAYIFLNHSSYFSPNKGTATCLLLIAFINPMTHM